MTESRLTEFRNGPLTFDVIDSGPLDGIPVVLLHGFPQRASSWNAVAEHLHERGMRTYAPDQRGYSPGARPRSRFAYGAGALISDVVALIDATGAGRVHLVGHDWGAAVSWLVAGDHPDRISSLTAISVPHPGAFVRSMLASTQALRSYYMALLQVPYLPERAFARRGGLGDRWLRASGMTPAMIEEFHTDMADYGALRGAINYYRSMFVASPKVFGRKVAEPTTLVWSDGDIALGRKGAELSRNWVTGPYELEVFEGVSHWILDERPAELAASIIKRIGV